MQPRQPDVGGQPVPEQHECIDVVTGGCACGEQLVVLPAQMRDVGANRVEAGRALRRVGDACVHDREGFLQARQAMQLDRDHGRDDRDDDGYDRCRCAQVRIGEHLEQHRGELRRS